MIAESSSFIAKALNEMWFYDVSQTMAMKQESDRANVRKYQNRYIRIRTHIQSV